MARDFTRQVEETYDQLVSKRNILIGTSEGDPNTAVRKYLRWLSLTPAEKETARIEWKAYRAKAKTGKVYKIFCDIGEAIKRGDAAGVRILKQENQRIKEEEGVEFAKPASLDEEEFIHSSEVSQLRNINYKIAKMENEQRVKAEVNEQANAAKKIFV